MTTQASTNIRSVAVIGAGIGGLGTAWLLRDRYRVRVFERNAYIGGHSNTVDVMGPTGAMPVDTGFMVFNDRNYPNLRALFGHVGVKELKTDMSFSVSIDGGKLEWAGTDLNTLFAQRSNIFRPGFMGMLRDVLRFNRHAKKTVADAAFHGQLDEESVGQWLDRHGLGDRFRWHYLLPMAAAIWSCPSKTILDYPALSLLGFFDNHGLLDLNNRPQWFTPKGGSREYVRRLVDDIVESQGEDAIVTQAGVEAVERHGEGIRIRRSRGEDETFDRVVIATHPDEALALLRQPTAMERRLLSNIRYQPNTVYLHSDPSLMPKRQSVWSAWNYMSDSQGAGSDGVYVSYWMNLLQSLPREDRWGPRDWFVTLNPPRHPAAETIARELHYDHPILDQEAGHARRLLSTIQGTDRIWYAGAYFGHGFHEDGFTSALNVAHDLGVHAPWEEGFSQSDTRQVSIRRAA